MPLPYSNCCNRAISERSENENGDSFSGELLLLIMEKLSGQENPMDCVQCTQNMSTVLMEKLLLKSIHFELFHLTIFMPYYQNNSLHKH